MKKTCMITTGSGIAPTLMRELKYLRYKPYDMFDTGVYLQCDLEQIAHLNVRLRTASKVRLQVKEIENCHSFETLFKAVESIDWKQYIDKERPISITPKIYKSKLDSVKTVQSISHKAIITSLTGSHDEDWEMDEDKKAIQVRISIANNHAKIFLNTSGNALHQRGRRQEQGEAPLKEHIAAALVLMTSRGYSSPLIDPYCGSGTILIEAAMIASNRAPGMERNFAFENFPLFEGNANLDKYRQEAKEKIFDKKYSIQGYDIDTDMIRKAQTNAKRAGVSQHINFKQSDSIGATFSQEDTIITNPPYGKRMGYEEAQKIHESLLSQGPTTKNLTVITGYQNAVQMVTEKYWKIKQVKNGKDITDVLFYNHS